MEKLKTTHSLLRTVFEFVSKPLPVSRHDETAARINAMNAVEELQSRFRRMESETSLRSQVHQEDSQERIARAMAFAYYRAFVVFSHLPNDNSLVEFLAENYWQEWMESAKHHSQMQIGKTVVESDEEAKATKEAYLLRVNTLKQLIVSLKAQIAVLRDRIKTLKLEHRSA